MSNTIGMKEIIRNLLTKIFKNIYFNTYFKLKKYRFSYYNREDFITGLKKIGIVPGDNVFIVCSADRLYIMAGRRIPIDRMLDDIINYLGSNGTISVWGFFNNPEILEKRTVLDVKKSPSQSGIFSELLRRKERSERSLHPFFSVISYGAKAKDYCKNHHKSLYPFDQNSPFYKIMEDNGKYLGIGVGFEAFTPMHMVDDYYKDNFKHKVNSDKPISCSIIDGNGKDVMVESFDKIDYNKIRPPGHYYYLKSLKIKHKEIVLRSGITLFTLNIKDFFYSAINLYNDKKITVWDTGSSKFNIFLRRRLATLKLYFG